SVNTTKTGADSKEYTNITVIVNSTTINEIYNNKTQNFTVILSDDTIPSVNNISFNYNITNLEGLLIVYANITDEETYIINATANITGPQNSFLKTITRSERTSDIESIWDIVLNSTNLNMTGTYYVNISAYDLGDNLDSSSILYTFNITDEYHFVPIEYSTYNRGETVTITLLDINNNAVNNANWTVNLTKTGENKTVERDGRIYNDDYSYYVATNDTDGNYTLSIINATKNGNYINNTDIEFNVSKNLKIVFNNTFKDEYFQDSYLSTIKAWLYNVRNELLVLDNVYVYYNGENYSMIYNLPGGPYRLNDLQAPSIASSIIPLKINVTDDNNNTGEVIKYIKTMDSLTNNPGGGGGSSISSTSPPYAPQYIIENKTLVANFNYTINNIEREIEQGFSDTLIGTIANTGDLPLTVHTYVSESPINISLNDNFTLDINADESFPINIYTNLSIIPKKYEIDLFIYNEIYELNKKRTLIISVKPNPIIDVLNKLNRTDYGALTMHIDSLQSAGIDVISLKQKAMQINLHITAGMTAIKNDNREMLEKSVTDATILLNSAQKEVMALNTLKFIYENRWTLTSMAVITLFLLYFIIYFVHPYIKIINRITKLRLSEKLIIDTRKATEKKYFMRQLNEMTFNKIMAQEEDKLLKIKSELAKLTKEEYFLKRLKFKDLRNLESAKKKEQERIKKEKKLKKNAKKKMSDIIVEHDMNKKKTIREYLGVKKKHKEFVFDEGIKKEKLNNQNFLSKKLQKIKTLFLKKESVMNSSNIISNKNILDSDNNISGNIKTNSRNHIADNILSQKQNKIESSINEKSSNCDNQTQDCVNNNIDNNIRNELGEIKKIIKGINKNN
ncbi:hypothetical protein GQ473_00855, partial [archaeon]|nr:hypothetical protein [archaeon]